MVIIGAGRIGQALAARAEARDVEVALVSRDEGWDALAAPPGDPVLLAVRNADLGAVIEHVPEARRDDLVFLQNGAIRELIASFGLGKGTRGLLYFAVAGRVSDGGGDIVEGFTCPFHGPHGPAVARWLGQLGLAARDVDWARFSYYELEKLLWLACHGVLCEKHGVTVGELVAGHRDELHALVAELLLVGRAALGVDVPADYVVDRLVRYSETIPTWSASVKEWDWRNGWLVDRAREHGIATPLHDALLQSLGHPSAGR